MRDDTIEAFGFAAIGRKKLTAGFDGGRITSDGGVLLLAAAERRLGIAERFAGLIADPRNPRFITHSVADILRARMLAIACGYEDADDLDHLRSDPGFKLACGRLPDSGRDLCSQPTVSRWENAPNLREVVRLTDAMVDLYCASYRRPPAAVTLDIDDTVDVVHGHQQLSLFNAHYDERCFLPIHVYDTATARPVAILLRPGKTPSGQEVRGHVRRLVRRIRSHWPSTRLTLRGDGHYARPEVMAWCEANAVDFIFGLPGNAVLSRLVEAAADDLRVRRAETAAPVLRRYAETRYGAKSWTCERRVAARIEASTQGAGHPLRGDQPGKRRRRMALRHAILRARTGRESDQTAQEPACLRPHQLPLGARQSGAPRAAHRRLLADADGARRHPQTAGAGHRRVHHAADAPAQDRRPHHRDRNAGPHRLCRRLPRSSPVPWHRTRLPAHRTVTHGACAPNAPDPATPTPITSGPKQRCNRRQADARPPLSRQEKRQHP